MVSKIMIDNLDLLINELLHLNGRFVSGFSRGFHCVQSAPIQKTSSTTSKFPQSSRKLPSTLIRSVKGQESDSGVGEGLKSTASKWLRAADKQPLQNCSKIQRSNLACNLVAMFHEGLHLWNQLLTGQTSLLYCTCSVGLLWLTLLNC